jgi:alpha-L-fucosidase 2
MGLSLGKGSNAPVQLDAAMGCVQAIQEMLLYAGKDFIKLLPALPARLGKGSIRNIRFMTGRLSMQWDMDKKRLKCKIEADRDTKVRLYLPEFVADKSISIYINDTNYDGFKSGDFLELSAGSELLMDIR